MAANHQAVTFAGAGEERMMDCQAVNVSSDVCLSFFCAWTLAAFSAPEYSWQEHFRIWLFMEKCLFLTPFQSLASASQESKQIHSDSCNIVFIASLVARERTAAPVTMPVEATESR